MTNQAVVVLSGGQDSTTCLYWALRQFGDVEALHDAGCSIAVETNGTLAAPEAQPERFAEMAFTHFFLQPMDSADMRENTQAAIRYCLDNPHRKLSLQTHKIVGIP